MSEPGEIGGTGLSDSHKAAVLPRGRPDANYACPKRGVHIPTQYVNLSKKGALVKFKLDQYPKRLTANSALFPWIAQELGLEFCVSRARWIHGHSFNSVRRCKLSPDPLQSGIDMSPA
jgi:hypothetical protein